MIYGCARVSTDGQSVTAQVSEVTEAGCGKVFSETHCRDRTNQPQLKQAIAAVGEVEV